MIYKETHSIPTLSWLDEHVIELVIDWLSERACDLPLQSPFVPAYPLPLHRHLHSVKNRNYQDTLNSYIERISTEYTNHKKYREGSVYSELGYPGRLVRDLGATDTYLPHDYHPLPNPGPSLPGHLIANGNYFFKYARKLSEWRISWQQLHINFVEIWLIKHCLANLWVIRFERQLGPCHRRAASTGGYRRQTYRENHLGLQVESDAAVATLLGAVTRRLFLTVLHKQWCSLTDQQLSQTQHKTLLFNTRAYLKEWSLI